MQKADTTPELESGQQFEGGSYPTAARLTRRCRPGTAAEKVARRDRRAEFTKLLLTYITVALLSSWRVSMAAIDWDWPAQLKTCQNRIVELENKVASQKLKIDRLVEQQMPATSAQLLLAIREESLTRARDYKRLIETRLADRA